MNRPKRFCCEDNTNAAQLDVYDVDEMDQWLTNEVLPVLRDAAESTAHEPDHGRPGHPAAWCPRCNIDRIIQQITEDSGDD